MSVPTATIRVTRETRDRLAEQASDRGMSISALMAQIAQELEIKAAFASESRASRFDIDNPDVKAE